VSSSHSFCEKRKTRKERKGTYTNQSVTSIRMANEDLSEEKGRETLVPKSFQ
jgi:hypothetical protein